MNIQPPSHDDVRVASQRFKNKKAAGYDGLSAELFKAGGNKLVGYLQNLIYVIWQTESTYVLSFKRETPWYALTIVYKVLISVLCERLRQIAKALIGHYQCDLNTGKSAIDQICTVRQIHEKKKKTFFLKIQAEDRRL